MTLQEPIFKPRSSPREDLRPTQEELAAFLKTPPKGGGQAPAAELAKYTKLLKETERFAQRRTTRAGKADLNERLFFGVLNHSRLFNQALLSAVVEYKYQLRSLFALNFDGPLEFIRSAEKEMSRLNMKKIPDVLRMKRLREMVEERKKVLAAIRKQWLEPAAEMRHIAAYVKDNLAKIETVCEAAVVILAELEIGRTRERELVEELKSYFKDRLKERLHRGQVTKQDLEDAKQEADMLTLELSILIREDCDAVSALFEALRGHVKSIAVDIVFLLDELAGKKGSTLVTGTDILKRIEQTLVALVSNGRFEPRKTIDQEDTEHTEILTEKRLVMLDYLFEQITKDRRGQADRRVVPDRRKSNDPEYKGPERRRDMPRRTGKNRRK